jgi:hypothetical protein
MVGIFVMFEIEQKQVGNFCQFFDDFGFVMARSFNVCMDPLRFGQFQQFECKFRLKNRVATRKRQPAARIIEIRFVAGNFVNHCFGFGLITKNFQGSRNTFINTLAATYTFFEIDIQFVVFSAQRTVFTAFYTIETVGAFVNVESQLWRQYLAFGIAAPLAMQFATFQKNGCSDSRAIVQRKFLYIENKSFHTIESIHVNLSEPSVSLSFALQK